MLKDFKLFANDHGVSSLALGDYEKMINNTYIEPNIVEERNLHATQISVFSRLFMERILFLGTQIDSMVANIVNSQLLFLDMESNVKPITLYINSPGGSVYDGLSIYDLFKYTTAPIHTTCVGMAASMAAVLLASGDKGHRSALPHSRVMIHQPLGGASGQASMIEIEYQEIMKCKEELYQILSDTTGKTLKEIEKVCDRDKWFKAEEAKKYGLIDNVISR